MAESPRVSGVILAGGVHALKAAVRPVVTSLTAGVANPVVSAVEDAISLVAAVLAIVAPYLIAALLLLALSAFVWWYLTRRGRHGGYRGLETKGDVQ